METRTRETIQMENLKRKLARARQCFRRWCTYVNEMGVCTRTITEESHPFDPCRLDADYCVWKQEVEGGKA